MDYFKESIKLHKKLHGKIEIVSKFKIKSMEDMSLLYTPGVAEPCRIIAQNEDEVYEYTSKCNTIAVITDGSAVLGLGNIGPKAALPVMEGKAILFKEFADINAVPICLGTQDVEEIINIIKNLSPTFGGINLEDISAPRCFEIERRLINELDIPVFHDDQHGTAIVVSAGIINSLKLVKKKIEDVKIVINGAGSAGISICKLLRDLGAVDITLVDLKGIICDGESWMNDAQKEIAKGTNLRRITGGLLDAMENSDIFIGVSAPNVLTSEMVSKMVKDSIVFAMANPIPEIMPDEAKKGGARVIATGRSDFPNQINNVLVFPGIFRGVLDARAKSITNEMKIAVAKTIANIIPENELSEKYIIPNVFNEKVVSAISKTIKEMSL